MLSGLKQYVSLPLAIPEHSFLCNELAQLAAASMTSPSWPLASCPPHRSCCSLARPRAPSRPPI
eukprot:14384033-Heterocapsa_arctica.AAC.1